MKYAPLAPMLRVLTLTMILAFSTAAYAKGSGADPATGNSADSTSTQTAYFAGGCFWGVEYYFNHLPGVVSADSGYMGGHVDKPGYHDVSSGRTGHVETVRVVFDPQKVTYESLARLFFEIHDPTQTDGQGPDIGSQYHSMIFYTSDEQKAVAEKLIGLLTAKGYKVATRVVSAGTFWKAEDYHQDYYDHKGTTPYCHIRKKRFD